MDAVILSSGLTKIYPDGTVALRDVDFSVERRGIITLLGRNGAGKTTFVRIAATLSMPTSGRLEILGMDVVERARAVRQRIALMPQRATHPRSPGPGSSWRRT
jgi:ABC-type multidrug transport system, ATPase component